MKKFRYTKTALASLLTLCSLNSFAVDREIKKLDSSLEVMKTSNKKLREKINKVCNNVPRKKEDKDFVRNVEDSVSTVGDKVNKASNDKTSDVAQAIKDKASTIKDKASNIAQATKDKASNVAQVTKDKASNVAQSTKDKASNLIKTEKNKASDAAKATETQKAFPVDSKKQDKNAKDNHQIKQSANKNISDKFKNENNGKEDENIRKDTGLKVTFGSVVETQGYYKIGLSDDTKQYNAMNKLATGNYSRNGGTFADAVLHLRAEGKNEDLSIAYGADVQLHVPVSKGKSDTYGIQAIRNRGVHAFLNTEYGDVKVGYQFGPEASMRLDATRIATADGGADSNWFNKVNLEGKKYDFPFYVTPRLYTESFSSGSAQFTFKEMDTKGHVNTLPFKVAYYSPSFMGFRFGLSYSPRYEESLFEMGQPGTMLQKSDLNFNDANSKGSKAYRSIVSKLEQEFNSKADSNIDKVDYVKKAASGIEALTQQDTLTKEELTSSYERLAQSIQNTLEDDVKDLSIDSVSWLKISDLVDLYGFTSVEAQDLKETTPLIKQGDADKAQIISLLEKSIGVDEKGGVKNRSDVIANLAKAGATAYKAQASKIIKNKIQSILTQAPRQQDLATHFGPSYEHIVSGGVLYEYYFDEYKLRVKAAAVGEYGKAGKPDGAKYIYDKYTEYHDLRGFNFGVIADYQIDEDQSIKFAGSFANLFKSGQPKNILELQSGKYEEVAEAKALFKSQDNNTMYWTLGASYQYENITTSLTYFGSKMNDGDKLHDISLGAQWNLSPKGSKTEFIPYVALHHFKTEEDTSHKKERESSENQKSEVFNKGTVVVAGVKFIF